MLNKEKERREIETHFNTCWLSSEFVEPIIFQRHIQVDLNSIRFYSIRILKIKLLLQAA